MINQPINAYAKGVLGEARALECLQAKGMILQTQRYHSLFGEIDLVLLDGGTLVFAEVKLRQKGKRYEGVCAVDGAKQERLIKTGRCYLAEHPHSGPVRFDVVEITRDGVMHIPDAFQGREW